MKKTILVIVLAILLFSLLTSCASAVTSEDVIKSFKDAGLEAENVRPMTKDDYGMGPYVCEGTRFYIPSLGEDAGGRLFICDDEKERDSLASYYTELGKSSALFFSWVFVKDNILVQINGDLPEETATKYEAAIP